MLDSRHDCAIIDSLTADDVRVEPDEGKLAELLLLVAEELAGDPFGGAVKVNKILFFAEFAHVRLTGHPITGAPYQKLRLGPAPRRLLPVRDRLVNSGSAELVTETVLGRLQHRLVPKRPAARQMFTETELQTIREAIAFLIGRTGAEVSGLSHDEPGWQLVNERDTIPFVTAYLAPDQARTSPRIQERAAQIAEEYAQRIHPAP